MCHTVPSFFGWTTRDDSVAQETSGGEEVCEAKEIQHRLDLHNCFGGGTRGVSLVKKKKMQINYFFLKWLIYLNFENIESFENILTHSFYDLKHFCAIINLDKNLKKVYLILLKM